MLIYALTESGRELEITRKDEPWCHAFEHSGNAYPMRQTEADEKGLTCERRDERFNIVGVGWKQTWGQVEELYALYMRDPIVWVLTVSAEHTWPGGRTGELPAELTVPTHPRAAEASP